MPFWVSLLPAAWNANMLAGAPGALLVHKVILSMEASARMVEQKSRGPWAPYGHRAVIATLDCLLLTYFM